MKEGWFETPGPYSPFTLYLNNNPKEQKRYSDAAESIQKGRNDLDKTRKKVCDELLGEYGQEIVHSEWQSKDHKIEDALKAWLLVNEDYIIQTY